MRKLKFPLIVGFIIALAITYIVLDRSLSYYGKNNFDLYNLLPLKIDAECRPDFQGGFALRDEYGSSIAAYGNTYRFNDTIIEIVKVVSYYYNKECLVANVLCKDDNVYHIAFTEKQLEKESYIQSEISKDSTPNIPNSNLIDLKVSTQEVKWKYYARNYISIVLLVLFIALIALIFRHRKLRIIN